MNAQSNNLHKCTQETRLIRIEEKLDKMIVALTRLEEQQRHHKDSKAQVIAWIAILVASFPHVLTIIKMMPRG